VTVHKVRLQHGLSVLPRRKRSRHKPKRYNRPVPGDRVQMDTYKIRPGPYQFTAIDDCGGFLVADEARHRNAKSTLAFLDQVRDEMSFSIQRIQTDRSAEFFAEEVQRRLMDEAIRFSANTAARSPHLNGKVERVQRTVLEEFWDAADSKAADVGEQLAQWVSYYNWHRPMKACTGALLLTVCVNLRVRRPFGAKSAKLTTPRKSVFASEIMP
jgi:transposase InsO family protein